MQTPSRPAGEAGSDSASRKSGEPSFGRRLSRRQVVGGALGAAVGASLSPLRPSATSSISAASITERMLSLSPEEKIAQLFCFEVRGTKMTDSYRRRLETTKPGGVIFVESNIDEVADIRPFIDAIRATNPEMPPLIAVDQEGGVVTRVPGDPSPGPDVLAKMKYSDLQTAAQKRSEFLRSYGFDVNFAPVADVAFTPDSIMADRSLGSDPDDVSGRVAEMVKGTRSTELLAAVKHFPGHGRTTIDSHDKVPSVDIPYEEWLATDAKPFIAAIEQGVGCVMLGHLNFPKWPRWNRSASSFSTTAVRVLRQELGFDGVIVTDDLGMEALSDWEPYEVLDRGLRAGVDMFLYVRPPKTDRQFLNHVLRRLDDGMITEARIDESLRRLAKFRGR